MDKYSVFDDYSEKGHPTYRLPGSTEQHIMVTPITKWDHLAGWGNAENNPYQEFNAMWRDPYRLDKPMLDPRLKPNEYFTFDEDDSYLWYREPMDEELKEEHRAPIREKINFFSDREKEFKELLDGTLKHIEYVKGLFEKNLTSLPALGQAAYQLVISNLLLQKTNAEILTLNAQKEIADAKGYLASREEWFYWFGKENQRKWNERNEFKNAMKEHYTRERAIGEEIKKLEKNIPQLKNEVNTFNKNVIELSDKENYMGESSSIPVFLKQVIFGYQHVHEAAAIGTYHKGATNISTNAVRFSTQGYAAKGGLTEIKAMEGMGSQVNAFRHTLWQATIAAKFGQGIALKAGNSHEENPKVDLNIRQFSSLSEADQSIDLLNNQMGRHIGGNANTQSMKELALKTLEHFHKEGLYTAHPNGGAYEIIKERIPDNQYNYMQSVFEKLDDNGFEVK